MAAVRFIPLGVFQFYVQSTAGTVAAGIGDVEASLGRDPHGRDSLIGDLYAPIVEHS